MEELERLGKTLHPYSSVRGEFKPEYLGLLTKKRSRLMVEWCDRVLVLGFSCSRFDLNLIKVHFAELLADPRSS